MAPDGNIPAVAGTSFNLGDFSIDEDRPMKIAVIGAGFSGINAAIRFNQNVPNVDLAVYEKNAGIGGTWFANKYPGLACDIPSHCYQYTFEEKTDWSTFYSPGKEIYDYLRGVVDKYKVDRFIKLNHELIHARYDEKTAKWDLKIRRPKTAASIDTNEVNGTSEVNGHHNTTSEPEVIPDPDDAAFEIIHSVVDFLYVCVGPLSRWSWPDIPGLQSFAGTLAHSAAWEGEPGDWVKTVESWSNKRVGVIGVGSSALQIVPALQSKVKGLWNFVRGKTWLAAPFAGDKMAELLGIEGHVQGNYEFSEEDKAKFNDVEYYKQFRRALESELNSVHTATLRGSKMQLGAVEAFRADMLKRLEKKPWIADHLIPDFPVACRRLTPGPGYLEALCEDNVEFVTTHIKNVNEKGIELVDGTSIELDVIVCATGYDTSYQFPFLILGRDGVSLQSRYAPHPQTYLTLCTDGFPNLFFSLGPNAGVGSGSLLVLMERQVDYAVKVVKKMQRERIRSIEASTEAVSDFEAYLEAYFPKTVYSAKCRSWYKAGKEEGRVVGLWPGSCLHAVRAFESPRWEDFKYEYVDEYDEEGVRKKKQNRFFWLGDGSTWNEMHEGTNRAWYLDDNEVNYPPVPQ